MKNKINFAEDIVKEVLQDFERISDERKALESQWRLNMNFVQGNQYCEISPIGDVEDYGKQYFWQEREVFNHIAPIIETRLAKLGRVQANVSVRPFSQDEKDINVAKLSTNVLKTISEENKLSEILAQSNVWSEICGSVFFKVVWNADKGRAIGEAKDKKIVKEGDIDIILCPPYEIFPDKITNNNIEDCKYIYHAKVYSVDEVKEIWDVQVEPQSLQVFSFDNVPNGGGLGYTASNARYSTSPRENSCLVIEKFERPSKLYPNGRHIIIAGDKLVVAEDLPYQTEQDGGFGLPFVRKTSLESVTNFYGSSIVERIIPVQRAYNGIKNKKHEFMNRIAMGVLAVEDGSVDTDNLEEEGLSPGKVLIYRGGCNPPRMLNMGSVPSEFDREESRLEDTFVNITGVSEFMRSSSLPSNVTSGAAISLLQEQDDTRISVSAESIRNAVKKIGQLILRLYKQFAVSRRLKRIAGDNGEIQLMYFQGSDLASDDLVFDTDNELNETPANRRNMVLELVKMGMFRDSNGGMSERNRLKLLEMLGFGNWESVQDINECHRVKAQKENMTLKEKEMSPMEYDNHQLHIDEHIKSVINEENESVVARINNHIKAHQMYLVMINQNNLLTEDNNARN